MYTNKPLDIMMEYEKLQDGSGQVVERPAWKQKGLFLQNEDPHGTHKPES